MLRATQRVEIVNKIAQKLQAIYSFQEIDIFLRAFAIYPPDDLPKISKKTYSSVSISNESDETLYRMAEELDIEASFKKPNGIGKPKNWESVSEFKLFISHLSSEKEKATRLRQCLTKFGINAFVAHEDMHPTLEWQSEIERALNSMDAFLAIHTKNYSSSYWSQQEIGFAYCLGVKIISLKMGEDPMGFISKHQAIIRGRKTAEIVSEEIFSILKDDPRTRAKMNSQAISLLNNSEEIPF